MIILNNKFPKEEDFYEEKAVVISRFSAYSIQYHNGLWASD